MAFSDYIFVFGSNLLGIHAKGAALFAKQHYGAVQGESRGFFGQSYAIATKLTPSTPLTLKEVSFEVDRFLEYASSETSKKFMVTRIGCGLAGFNDEQIFPLFANKTDNVLLPYRWLKLENPNMPVRVLIAGSRKFNDYDFLVDRCDHFLSRLMDSNKDFEIVTGGAKGADTLAERYSTDCLQKRATVIKADWEKFGKSAGMVRNEWMGWYSSNLIAFWDGKSPGTKQMIDIAKREEMPFRVVNFS